MEARTHLTIQATTHEAMWQVMVYLIYYFPFQQTVMVEELWQVTPQVMMK